MLIQIYSNHVVHKKDQAAKLTLLEIGHINARSLAIQSCPEIFHSSLNEWRKRWKQRNTHSRPKTKIWDILKNENVELF
jgi:hypothetical protein